jgi:tetratricopeptide (TPR) repeat protein
LAKPVRPDVALAASLPVASDTTAVEPVVQEPDTERAWLRNPFLPNSASLAIGQELFEQNCTNCHGLTGRGDGLLAEGLTIPPADLLTHIPLHADIELFRIVRDGKSFSPMPSFVSIMTTDEIWHLVNYLRAFKVDQSLAEDYFQAAQEFAAQGDHQQALASLDEAIELSPKHALAYNLRGTTFSRLGDFERAIADHSRAVELKPDFAEAYFNRAVDQHAARNLEQAILDYGRSLELASGQPDPYYARGLAYVETGDLKQAIRDFDQALDLYPDYTRIYLDRGQVHKDLGDLEQALNDLKQYLKRAPEAVDRQAVTGLVAQLEARLSPDPEAPVSSEMGLTLADFPPGFEAIPPADLGLVAGSTIGDGVTSGERATGGAGVSNGEGIAAGGGLTIEHGFAFGEARQFELVWGFTTQLPTGREQANFDANLGPDNLVAILTEGLGGATIEAQKKRPTPADLGDAAVALTAVIAAEDQQTRVDGLAFRQGTVGTFIFVMHAAADGPLVSIDELAGKLNERLGAVEISQAPP